MSRHGLMHDGCRILFSITQHHDSILGHTRHLLPSSHQLGTGFFFGYPMLIEIAWLVGITISAFLLAWLLSALLKVFLPEDF